ncbi:MAG TPA: GAF domain-containing protein [Verrucomicrobiae bacterium]|nr:GAF domain-containing protein [Verrucomicrobiae bacterium]
MQRDAATRTPQSTNATALVAHGVRFPGEDHGSSLAEMAQRDLDAALQLLTDRAQYITGSSGAAIALRRNGKNDMLCRASTGENAPELGALLSTEFGLSGESVRTRRPLRCDDAERDARVNREVCRQMGIASVVVMPVVNDDEVLGVFELFSGKVNAFGERDLSALRRLSEMVETAVKLAHSAEKVAVPPKATEPASQSAARPNLEEEDDTILEIEVEASRDVPTATQSFEAPATAAVQLHAPKPVELEAQSPLHLRPEPKSAPALPVAPASATKAPSMAASPAPAESPEKKQVLAKKAMFWSAAYASADAQAPPEPDQTNVPPVLRNLRKCESCGFPISASRTLCVECEEKKWRGQLRLHRPVARPAPNPAHEAAASTVSGATPSSSMTSRAASPAGRAFAAAAQSVATPNRVLTEALAPAAVMPATPVREPNSGVKTDRSGPVQTLKTDAETTPRRGPREPSNPMISDGLGAPQPAGPSASAAPELILSAGLAPSQSWLGAHKYILAALLLIGAAVAAALFLR